MFDPQASIEGSVKDEIHTEHDKATRQSNISALRNRRGHCRTVCRIRSIAVGSVH